MVKKTVLKVDINCLKCKKKLLKTVSSIQGVDKIEADEGKGTLTVIGDADPYEIIVRIRKAGKHAEVVSIGPPPAPPKQDAQKKPQENKKPEEKKKPDPVNLDQKPDVPFAQMPYYYPPPYQPVTVVHMKRWDEPNPSCTILEIILFSFKSMVLLESVQYLTLSMLCASLLPCRNYTLHIIATAVVVGPAISVLKGNLTDFYGIILANWTTYRRGDSLRRMIDEFSGPLLVMTSAKSVKFGQVILYREAQRHESAWKRFCRWNQEYSEGTARNN
ncbi:hypothetical protein VNO77_40654 [Canavalia gladiata]|uniref:HMA domain-containing protein n=1 Tax=Canavalia gladiata TaxID=3824 RepID=A0AAN9PS22_CANGL